METAVFFDVDETLVRPEASVQTIYEKTCEQFGVAAETAACQYFFDQFFEHLGTSPDPYLAAAHDLVAEHSLQVDVASFVTEYTKQEVRATSVSSAVAETLDALRQDCSLGVITNGVTAVQQAKLEFHEVDDYFETVIAASDIGAPKPDREMFQVAKQTTDADRRVYVGDSVDKDITPAQDSGFETILVGAHDATVADLVIPDHSEFPKVSEFVSP